MIIKQALKELHTCGFAQNGYQSLMTDFDTSMQVTQVCKWLHEHDWIEKQGFLGKKKLFIGIITSQN